jgi:hypothetical protein
MRSRHRVAALALALALAGAGGAAAAETRCGAPELVAQRIAEIEATLDRESRHLAAWRAAWISGLTASAIAQVATGALVERRGEVTFYVGAIEATALAAPIPILGPRVSRPPPADPGQGQCARLSALRRMLLDAAERQRRGVAWHQHGANLAIHLAGSLYLGLREGEWLQAVVTGAIGAAVGELKILTQPRGAIRALEGGVERKRRLVPALAVLPGGLGIAITLGI